MRLSSNQLTLDYELVGPSTAPVVALGHNFAADRGVWDAQLEALAEFRVLRWDMRGHGRSSTPPGPYRLDELADDLVAILDREAVQRCHYCGVSMGGMVGQHFALRHRQRVASLVLVNTTSEYSEAQRGAWHERVERVRVEGTAPLHDELMARWFTAASLRNRPPGVDLMSAAYLRFSPEAFVACAEMIKEVATTERLAEINVPTLIIAGAEDPATPPAMSEVMHERISQSEYHVIDAAAHLSQIEQAARFNESLLAFLRRVT